jgi:hypothetical protein
MLLYLELIFYGILSYFKDQKRSDKQYLLGSEFFTGLYFNGADAYEKNVFFGVKWIKKA